MYDFGIVCSYDEIKLFRTSAAFEGNKLSTDSVLRDHNSGLIQAVSDNFDCNISSPNGLKQTHSLAMLLAKMKVTLMIRKHSQESNGQTQLA